MARKQQFQTRLDADDAELVERYADEHDISNSEAVRRFVRRGIDTTDQPGRDEIAADLQQIKGNLRDVRDSIEQHEEPEEGVTDTLPQRVSFRDLLYTAFAAAAFYAGTVVPI